MNLTVFFENPYVIGFCVAMVVYPIFLPAKNLVKVIAIIILLIFFGKQVNFFGIESLKQAYKNLSAEKFVQRTPKKIIKLSPGRYLVSANVLNIRLAPNTRGKIVSTLEGNKSVRVFETKGHFARISTYFDGSPHGQSGNIAHWVASEFLVADSNKNRAAQVRNSAVDQCLEQAKAFDKQFGMTPEEARKAIKKARFVGGLGAGSMASSSRKGAEAEAAERDRQLKTAMKIQEMYSRCHALDK